MTFIAFSLLRSFHFQRQQQQKSPFDVANIQFANHWIKSRSKRITFCLIIQVRHNRTILTELNLFMFQLE
jgi:hypothetical protein